MDRIATVTVQRGLAVFAGVLGLGALLMADRTGSPGGPATTTALEVARALRADPESIVILDLRDSAAFAEFHLPRARHLPVRGDSSQIGAELEDERLDEWLVAFERLGLSPEQRVVLGGNAGTPTRELWLALRRAGLQVLYWPDMIGDWVETIVSPVRTPTDDPVELTRWSEVSGLSRYFGGLPRVVDRRQPSLDTATRLQLARRRGCAF